MNGSSEDDLNLVARRLRSWRDEAGLTLQQLAERCGVATSTIQKIETRQMVPTIGVLLKIAEGLGKRASEFVRSEGSSYQVHHSKAQDRRIFGDDEITLERLGGDLRSPDLEVWRVRAAPGVSHYRDGINGHGEALVICELGEFTVQIDGKSYEMTAGDTLHFKAELPHGWENHANLPAQFVLVGTMPQALRAVLVEP